MNLYAHDCSYLRTEYGRNKDIESYHAEIHRECDEYRIANGQKPILDDGEQEGNEYIPGTAPDTKGRRVV